MGKKKVEEGAEPQAAVNAEPEDPPIVKELKKVDDDYLAVEREYEKALNELQKKYEARRAPLLEQRTKVLTSTDGAAEEDKTLGTPALNGFWLQAMQNLPALEDQIEEWDCPVLVYLKDIKRSHLDPDDPNKGFKLTFVFAENPYFTNTELWKEYHTEESSPYTGEIDTQEIKSSEIDWKPGKNVTVETVAKKAKGGGAKKAKQKAKGKEEPRDSFFRHTFRNLTPDMPLPDDMNLEDARGLCASDDDEDDEQMMAMIMENDYEIGCSIREMLVPYAVRWYTGEAAPEGYGDDDDDEDEEEEEEDEDDDEEDDDDEDDEPPRRGGKPRRGGGAKAAGGEDKKECKQQ